MRQALGDIVGIVRSLAGVAEVAMVQGKAIRSLRLYAASEMLRREINLSLTTSDQADLERNLAALGEQVGQPVFAAAWAEGAAMTLEEAVASALEQEVASSP